jgi:hypothetical protein
MSRRIEIEITSLNGDVATWRAAGAKLPKGVLNSSLVPGGPVVGNVYRADVEQYMEGIEILSVMAPKTASPVDPRHERLELIPTTKSGPDVIVTYAPKGRGGSRRDGADTHRDGGPGRREKGPGRREFTPGRKESGSGRRENGPGRRESGASEGSEIREGSPRPERTKRPPRNPVEREDATATSASSERPVRAPRSDRPARGARPPRPERPVGPVQPPMTTTHRNSLLATLSPEQLPVAEQLLRGGMPSVRAAVAEQNKNATAQGRPTIDAATIERIAEDLLSRTTLALWKDRAAGAIGAGRELRLRDLRAVVTSAKTVSLDEEARVQLKELQVSLTARLEYLRTQWNAKLEAAIESKNVKEALTLVARPPDMSTRVSADVAARVIAITSEALSADADPTLWKEIVELTVDTSIRRNVKPQGIPDDESSKAVAIHNAGAIPEFARLLGMKVPPPPPPTRIPRRPTTRRPPTRRAS